MQRGMNNAQGSPQQGQPAYPQQGGQGGYPQQGQPMYQPPPT